MPKVLHIVTNAGQYDDGTPTGLWLGELVHVYDQLESAGVEQVIASPLGGVSPIEPRSLGPLFLDAATKARSEDAEFMRKLEHTVKLADVDLDEFDAINLPGGHGAMFDLPESQDLANALSAMDARGGVIASVCHGPAGVLGATDADGLPLVAGRRMTGYSWIEEVAAGVSGRVPFNLEEQLKVLGAEYERAAVPFLPHAIADGTFISGQNPASAKRVGAYLLEALGVQVADAEETPGAALATIAKRPEARYSLLGVLAVGATALAATMLSRRGRRR